MRPQIVLASASPRRRELLAEAGVQFTVRASGVPEETTQGSDPEQVALELALAKARAVAVDVADGLVLGADTVVVIDGEILGKPIDRADAVRMLELLRNRWHQVITGVALIDTGAGRSGVKAVTTAVRMADYRDEAIHAYVESGEPLDKAGSYAIQGLGGRLVAEIKGSYTNVVGLPLDEVAVLFRELGHDWPSQQ